jgi:hypothetical protein
LPLAALVLAGLGQDPPGIVPVDQADDAPLRAAGLLMLGLPFFYLILVPICFLGGRLLFGLGLLGRSRFLAGAAVLAIGLGLAAGLVAGASARGDAGESFLVTTFIGSMLALASALPAAFCWWWMVVRPVIGSQDR